MDSRTSPVAANRRHRRARTRHGVSSVLAMMFLVIFSSLAAAMAVVAQGNLRTADSYMKVSRAMSAAETGLVFAQRRLASESSRFVVLKGVIDDKARLYFIPNRGQVIYDDGIYYEVIKVEDAE